MNNLRLFLRNFIQRSGNYVFAATIIARLLSFFASWIAIKLIPNKDLGIVIYSFQIVSFIIPVAGFGLHQSLIRYGAQLKSIEEKNTLFYYTFKKGAWLSILLAVIVVVLANTLKFNSEKVPFYLSLLSVSILTNYILELIKIQFRLQKNNKQYAYIEISYNIILVILVYLLSFYFQELGYAIALIIVPLIVSLLFFKKLKIVKNINVNLEFINYKFWRYGFFASLSNVGAQLLIAIDIILIGNILQNMEMVTAFKYISIVPYSIIFLSQVVIITDFVDFTEKIYNKKYILNYIKNYMLLFLLISIICISGIKIFGSYILKLFNSDYDQYQSSLLVLTIGVSGILIIRGLFGNLLSSIGKAHLNFIITSIAIVLNILLNYQLIPKYGIFGGAITSAILMWFTGILCMLFFFYHFKNSKNSSDS